MLLPQKALRSWNRLFEAIIQFKALVAKTSVFSPLSFCQQSLISLISFTSSSRQIALRVQSVFVWLWNPFFLCTPSPYWTHSVSEYQSESEPNHLDLVNNIPYYIQSQFLGRKRLFSSDAACDNDSTRDLSWWSAAVVGQTTEVLSHVCSGVRCGSETFECVLWCEDVSESYWLVCHWDSIWSGWLFMQTRSFWFPTISLKTVWLSVRVANHTIWYRIILC